MVAVLVVDDSPVDRQLLHGLLSKRPEFEVSFAENGQQAMDAVAERSFDVVVTDLVMPKVNGLQLVEHLHRHHPGTPVILVTSQGSEEMAIRALDSGASSYVPKRLLAQRLVPTVDQVLAASRHRHLRNRLLHRLTSCAFTFELENDCRLFGPLVDFLQEMLVFVGMRDECELTRLSIAVQEAVTNAMFHGNLELDSAIREQGDEHFFAMVEKRQKEQPFADRRVIVNVQIDRDTFDVSVADQGRGFAIPEKLDQPDPSRLQTPCGRGLMLMQAFMDKVDYQDQGRRVRLVKRLPCRNRSSGGNGESGA